MFMLVHICTINNTAQSHTAWSMERKLSISEALFAFHNITNYISKLLKYQHLFFVICVSFSCLNKSVIYAVRNFTLRFLVSWLYPCLDCCGLRCSTWVSWASVLPPDPCWRRDSRVDTLTGETTAFLSLAPNTTCVQFTPLYLTQRLLTKHVYQITITTETANKSSSRPQWLKARLSYCRWFPHVIRVLTNYSINMIHRCSIIWVIYFIHHVCSW